MARRLGLAAVPLKPCKVVADGGRVCCTLLDPCQSEVSPVVIHCAERVAHQLGGVIGPLSVLVVPRLQVYEVRQKRMLRTAHKRQFAHLSHRTLIGTPERTAA